MKLFFYLAIFLFVGPAVVKARMQENAVLGRHEAVQKFDENFYRPQDNGMRDMYVEVRIVGLTEKLKKRIGKVKMEAVHFRVYWVYPNTLKVEVIGLGDGFKTLKQELAAVVIGKMNLILPTKLTEEFRSYRFTGTKKDGKFLVKGVDSTNMNDIAEVYFQFDKTSKMTNMRLLSAVGTKLSDFKMSKKPWSKGKFILDGMSTKVHAGVQTTSIEQKIEYKVVSGHGLPLRIVQDITQTINRPENLKKNTNVSNEKSIMVFSRHMANENVARKYLQRLKDEIKKNKKGKKNSK